LQSHSVGNGLDDRVALLRKLAWSAKGGLRDPAMRRIGLLATRHCPPRSDACELRSIFDFVVRNVRYTGDIAGKDTFSTPLRTLQYGGEDCDGHAVLAAVLAMENGFQTIFRITSNTGASWDHIFCMAGIPKHRPVELIALDTTLGPGRFGKEPRYVKKADFKVGD
jgi:hypothetical protein